MHLHIRFHCPSFACSALLSQPLLHLIGGITCNIIFIKKLKCVYLCFKGNEVRCLLKRTDKLSELLPAEHYRFLRAFESFDAVVTSCFSYELDAHYLRYIKEFESAWKDLGISVTPKVNLSIQNPVGVSLLLLGCHFQVHHRI